MHRPIRLASAMACLAAVAALTGCDISRPEIVLRDVKVAAMDFEKIELVYEFEVTNPNTYIVTLWGFDVAWVAAGEQIAAVTLDKPVTAVPTGGRTVVLVPVTIRFDDVPLVVARAGEPSFLNLTGSATISFMGRMRVYPFAHEGYLPALRKPSWHFTKLRLANRAEGIVELGFEVDNPNPFPLPLARLKGTLHRGDEQLLEVNRIAPGSVPPGKTARLVLPVKVDPARALRAAAAAEATPRALKFVGELQLTPPPELRPMLLGEAPSP